MKKNNDINTKNIFADLGLSNPEERLAKAELARQINNLIKQKNITQTDAAKLLNVDQPKISALNKGKLTGFSLERLFNFLNILGQNITIKITPKISSQEKASVNVNIPKTKKNISIKHTDTSSHATMHAQNTKKKHRLLTAAKIKNR